MATTLIVPGLHSSGQGHWQTWFEERIPGSVRVIQADWGKPDLPAWSQRVRRDITRTPGKIVIAAHSFGALAAVQAANDHSDRIAGALLVAPADPEKFGVADLLPKAPLAFPAVVVGSTNDPWMALERAAYWADTWGADLVNLGAAGHINAEAGFGPWPEGLSILERLLRGAEWRAPRPRATTLRQGRYRRTVIRSRSFGRSAEDRAALKHAAMLLEEAGWHLSPPAQAASVIRAVHQ